MKYMQKGQVVIILVLVMLVVLILALAISQRTVTDLSTSNRSEQASRAFSAAESGIEQAISSNHAGNLSSISLKNQSVATNISSNLLPSFGSNMGIEYPPVGKDTVAQFWLMDPYQCPNFPVPDSSCSTSYPAKTPFRIYYGNQDSYSAANPPAIEVNLITYNSTSGYTSTKRYYDGGSASVSRNSSNGFLSQYNNGTTDNFTCASVSSTTVNLLTDPTDTVSTTEGVNRQFVCRIAYTPATNDTPVMVRIRLLYSDISQPIALIPQGSNNLPPQVIISAATGTAGQAEKKLRVFQAPFIAPAFFDYAIFSPTDIMK